MVHFHAVVWLDHHEAKVFHFNADAAEEIDIKTNSPSKTLNVHTKTGTRDGKRHATDPTFLHDIVDALKPAKEWLIVGPGSAKSELVKFIHRRTPGFADCVIGVETVDHPTDAQLVALARAYFKAADRMRPQIT
ncbi:MAG: translational machinery protein [Alphaproteobacteria bacterium]|nr:translational machinery protein [Alphaproteobacteria bacterium]